MSGSTPADGALRLRQAAADGGLEVVADRLHLDLLVLFGSVIRDPGTARDLDVGVLAERGRRLDVRALFTSLLNLALTDDLDVMDLERAAPVAQEQALVAGEVLYERRPGLYASAQIAATTMRMDTAWLRSLDLDLMAPRDQGARVSPGDLAPAVVHAKLRSIRELLAVLEELGVVTHERLVERPVEQLAVERILTVIVDLAVGINSHLAATQLSQAPSSYRSSFADVARVGAIADELAGRPAPSAGMRNVLVHRYDEIDRDRLADAARRAVDDYREYVRQVAGWVLARPRRGIVFSPCREPARTGPTRS